jgi:Tfp pilus assembly protein PilF
VRNRLALAAGLAIATAATFHDATGLPFIGFDDPEYVTQNAHVLAGLTPRSAAWALTTSHASNWHPVTWLSHMADVSAFGLDPGGPHAVNAALHVISAVLLFLLLVRTTAAPWRSALAAALFALHPLRVESVAWVSERKDVLGTVLWLATMHAYVGWVRRPSPARGVLVASAFAAGLAAKPMLVTLPFALLLLDVWPLRRLAVAPLRARDVWPFVREKLPLFALSGATCAITILAQRGAMKPMERTPFLERAANAVVAIPAYVGKSVWPSGLAIFYPWRPRPVAIVAAAALALVVASALAWRVRERRPYVLVGWAWFLGTLVPVLGLVQVGNQAMADRYTYVPSIGLCAIAAWALPWPRRRALAIATGAAALGVVAVLGALTVRQIGFWRTERSLFEHALEVTEGNWVAETIVGVHLERAGDGEGAMARYRRALELNPRAPQALNNLGNALVARGRHREGIAYLAEAVRLWPAYAIGLANLGSALTEVGAVEESIPYLADAARRLPESTGIRFNLALALERAGRFDEALARFEEVVRSDPGDRAALAHAQRLRAWTGR